MGKKRQWKRNGRMMTMNQFYQSPLHFSTETSYQQYKQAYKRKFKKR